MTPLRRKLGAMPIRWRWTLHNLVGHPLSEIVYQIGLRSLGNAIHDATIPYPVGEDGRG